METQNNVPSIYPIYQSTNVVPDAAAKVEGVKVRSVTPFTDDEGRTKMIINLDLTTVARMQSVVSDYRKALQEGSTEPVQERNLSINILPVFGTDNDFSSKFVPAKGERVDVQLEMVETKDGRIVCAVIDIYPQKAIAAKKISLADMLAGIDAEVEAESKVVAEPKTAKGKK